MASFDKKRIGKAVVTGLRQLTRQLRVDVERRLKSFNHDGESINSEGASNGGEHPEGTGIQGKGRDEDENFRAMRVAKIMGAWLSSIVGWHDKYFSKLEVIEQLSAAKASIESKLLESGIIPRTQ